MKRFRSRKNSPERGQGSRRPSLDSDPPAPPLPSFASMRWGGKKKVAPQPKPEINISAALPASEDFRTSLLMPNLSARFSMLREQDDPSSKIGKANDDSVLFPKRASRLELFKGHGLSYVTEVDSLHGTVRPPFASIRTESYGSGSYDTDDGSVMSRSRPGEGNTMFGGRQKIYKIPVGGAGSVKHFGAKDDEELPSGVNMGGKALYESDIATSAFQRLREEERQERERASLEQLRSSKEQDRDGSPPLAKYNQNRETSSSTNSGRSQPRTSTAATSVASQRSIYYENMSSSAHALSPSTQPSSAGSDRPIPKATRRLYRQDLDQHLHEQQSSAMHRLESLNKPRSIAGGPAIRSLQQSRSATGLNDRYQRGGPLYASNGFRAASPPPSGTPSRMEEFDLGLVPDQAVSNLADSGYGRSPPLSPPMSPSHDPNNHDTTFLAALEPNDLGKATASGAFKKPKLQYDDRQYKERQIQLLEGRNTPSPQLIRPFSPQALSIDEQTTGRSRNNSIGSTFSRTESVKQPWEHHREDRVLRAVPERGSRGSSPPVDEHHTNTTMEQSFLAGRSSSDVAESESEAESNFPIPSSKSNPQSFSHLMSQAKPVSLDQQLNFDPEANHLTPPAEESAFDSRSHLSESTITQPKENNEPNGIDADSPTLGPVRVANGLSGLVHAHLRNDSGQSSIYPEDSPRPDRFPVEVRQSIFGHESALNHSRQGSKDDSGVNGEYWVKERRGSEQSSIVAPPPLSFAARHILQQATALRDNQQNPKAQQVLTNDKAQRVLGGEAPRSSHSRDNSTSWQDQLKAHHARVGSTETQQEREGLATEMAARRRRVQDNLKTYVEDNSRSPSPAPGVRPQEDGLARPRHQFGILKKTSRGSLVGKQERPSKAMKMLGIRPGEAGHDAPQPPPDMFMGRGQFHDRAMPRGKKTSPPPRRPQDLRQHSDNSPGSGQRLPNSGRSQENLAQRISSPSSKSGSSYSDSSEKRLESGKDSDPLPRVDRNRINGSHPVTAATGYEPREVQNAARPADGVVDSMPRSGLPPAERSQSAMSRHHPMSPTERSQSAMGGRLRSNSKPVTPSYFEPRAAPPGTPFMINPKQSSRVPPPGTPYMINPKTPSRLPTVHPNRPRAESTATSNESRPSTSSMTSSPSTLIPSQSSPSFSYNRPGNPRKRSVNKQDISEPTFVSCTSSVDTVNLPPGASLSNGMDAPSPTRGPPPPIPVRDSRRKRTQTFLQALGRTEKPLETTSTEATPSHREDDPYEECSTFSADDEPTASSKMRQRLRKTSSEGGLNAKAARQAALQAPSPAVPNFEVQSPGLEQHFPYQAQKDVPASAVMF
ncbi:hypothetical protein HO133_001911 [Letharia lupina]|uniref:Uncharacterized protein n=1 Tax=Letharia lupina TaxID=560253 RepID=A0A8H6FBN5_9LECA|nr:uncharacterized protein HO133_001911 [Letharia lupina]KAF6221943.1 hypothetical protein HO133_001911 [Letharia lupina]